MSPSAQTGQRVSKTAIPGAAQQSAGSISRARRLPLGICLAVAPLPPRSSDALELPEHVAAPVNAHRRAVPDAEGVVLDLLASDRLATGEAFESRSKAHADGLREYCGQPAV